jgi:hypothetical protein
MSLLRFKRQLPQLENNFGTLRGRRSRTAGKQRGANQSKHKG